MLQQVLVYLYKNIFSFYFQNIEYNRVFAEYPVGSVFKPLVAASALEQGINPKAEYNCTGKIYDGNVEFGCVKSHGQVNMATALINSCNCYFVDYFNVICIFAH